MPLNRRLVALTIAALQLNLVLILRQLMSYAQSIQRICHLMSSVGINKKISLGRNRRSRKPPRFWVRPGRTQGWWPNFVNNSVVEEWKENFRMTKKTFTQLCNELRQYIQQQDRHLREAVDVDTTSRVAAILLPSN